MRDLNRREFLSLAAATGASGAAVGMLAATAAAGKPGWQPPAGDAKPQPVSAGTKPARTLRKAVMYGMIGEGENTLDRFKILRDAGFAGVEMDSPTKIPMDEIVDASVKTGIVVHGLVDSVHWSAPLNHPAEAVRGKAMAGLRACLRDAKTLGCSSILLVPAVVNKDLGYADAWTRSIEAVREVMAESPGVTIGIENVWNNFINTPLEAARYLDELNRPLAGAAGKPPAPPAAWHFDIGNIINFGWPSHWVEALGTRICKLHIKDFSRSKRDKEGLWKGFDVELGEGDADWPAVMSALDKTGYATAPGGNWATAEVRGGDRKRLEQLSGLMDKVLGA